MIISSIPLLHHSPPHSLLFGLFLCVFLGVFVLFCFLVKINRYMCVFIFCLFFTQKVAYYVCSFILYFFHLTILCRYQLIEIFHILYYSSQYCSICECMYYSLFNQSSTYAWTSSQFPIFYNFKYCCTLYICIIFTLLKVCLQGKYLEVRMLC